MVTVAVVVGQFLLAGVFVMAVASKVRDGETFTRFTAQMLRPGGVPAWFTAVVARGTVAAEAAAAVLLLTPIAVPVIGRWSVPAGFALSALLLLGFSTAVAVAVRRRVQAPCGCFGRSATPLGARHVVRNSVLLVVAGGGLAASAQGAAASPAAMVVLAAGTIGVALAIAVAAFDEVVALFAPTATRTLPSGGGYR